jgi:hypothetical protein
MSDADDTLKRIDAALAATSDVPKCKRQGCSRPKMMGLSHWDLGEGLCEQCRREHLDRERQAKNERLGREEQARKARREAEEADRYAMHRYIGKCKACNAHTSVLAQLKKVDGKWGYFTPEENVLQERGYTFHTPCRQCGKMVRVKQVQGKYNPGIECNAKCQAAKGPNCECRCKGLNHGSAWGG